MADQITFGQFASNIEPQTFIAGEFELDPELIEKRKKEFQDQAKKSVRKAYIDWLSHRELKGWGDISPVEYPDYDTFAENAGTAVPVKAARSAAVGIGDVLTEDVLAEYHAKTPDKFQKDYKAWVDFQNFWKERNKARVETMNPVFLQSELEQGGVDLSHSEPRTIGKSSPATDVFLRSFIQSSTLGLLNTDSPIYGSKMKQFYSKSNTAGNILGEIVALTTLAHAAQGLGVTTKIAQALQKSNTVSRWVRLTGHLPASMRRGKSIINGARGFGEIFTTFPRLKFGVRTLGAVSRTGKTVAGRRAFEQGVQQITSAMLFGVADTTRNLTKQYLSEDKMKLSNWEKLWHPGRDFVFGALKGAGISAINAPTSWGVRFVADGMWATANQAKNVITGGEWNANQFFNDWIVSHAIGERYQILRQVAALPKNNPVHKTRDFMHKRNRDFRGLPEDIQYEIAAIANLTASKLNVSPRSKAAEGFVQAAAGSRRSARAQQSIIIDSAKILTGKYKEVLPAIERAKHENYIKIDDPAPTLNANRRQMVIEIAKEMKLSPEQIDHLIENDATLSPEHLLGAFKDLKLQKQLAPELITKFTDVKRERLINHIQKLEALVDKAPDGPKKKQARLEYLEAKQELAELPEVSKSIIKGISDHKFVEDIYDTMQKHSVGKDAESEAYRKILQGDPEEALRFILPSPKDVYQKPRAEAPAFKPTGVEQESINRVRGAFLDDLFVRDQLTQINKLLRSRLPANKYGQAADDIAQNLFLRLLSKDAYPDKRIAANINQWKRGSKVRRRGGATVQSVKPHPDFDINNSQHIKELAGWIMKDNAFKQYRDRINKKGEFSFLREEERMGLQVDKQTVEEFERGSWVNDTTGEMTALPDKQTPLDEAFFQRSLQVKKFRDRAASTKERIKAAGKDAKNTGGIDLSPINNKDFQIMSEIARNSPQSLRNVLIRFWDNAYGMTHDQIREHLGNFGISRNISQINKSFGKMLPSNDVWQSALIKLGEPLKTLVRTSKRASYNLSDVKKIYELARQRVGEVNPSTGIPTRIDGPRIRDYINKNGVMVVGIREYAEALSTTKNEAHIGSFKAAVGTFIKNEVIKYNKAYSGQKGNPRIILRHPIQNKNTDFLITGSNLDPTDFKGAAVDIYNRLTNRYPLTSENISKAFAVRIQNETYNKIPNATLSFTKNISDLLNISDKHTAFNKFLQRVSPKQYRQTEDIILDLSNNTVRALVNSMTAAGDIAYAERLAKNIIDSTRIDREQIQEIVDNTPVLDKSKPSITLAEEDVRSEDIMGTKPKESAVIRNKIKSPNSQITVERELQKSRPVVDDDTGIQRFIKEANSLVIEKANQVADNLERIEEKTGLFAGLKDKIRDRIRGVTEPVRELAKGKFTIFEDILKIEPTTREIIMTMGRKETAFKDFVSEQDSKVYKDFYGKYKDNPKLLNLFNKAEQWMAEMEMSYLSEGGEIKPNNMLKGSADQKSAEELVNDPITNGDRIEGLIQKVIQDPSEWNEGWLNQIFSLTKDNLFFSKFMVQKLNVPFKDLYDVVARSQELVWKFGGDLASQFDLPPGAYRINNPIENIRKSDFERLGNFFRRYGELSNIPAKERNTIFFEDLFNATDDVDAAKRVMNMASVVKDAYEDAGLINEGFSRHFNGVIIRLKSIVSNNADNFVYRHHAVLADPDNKRFYGSRLNKISEEGRLDVGQGALNPYLYDIKGRKNRTLKDLVQQGYKIDHDSRNIGRGFLGYVSTRQINYDLGRGWKEGFMKHTDSVLKPLKELEIAYDEVKANVKNYPIETQVRKLREILSQIDTKKNEIIAAWGEHDGVVYIDNTKDNSFWKTRISEIDKLLTEELDPNIREKLELDKLKLERQVVLAQDIHDFSTGKIFTKKKKDFLKTFKNKIPELDAGAAKDLEQRIENQEFSDRGLINDSLFDANLGEVYMPVNAKAHTKDKNSNQFSTDREYIYTKPLRHDPNKLNAPNIPGFEGLYLHRALHKGLKQFVFRYDYEQKFGSSAAAEFVKETYDTLNQTMKSLTFWKPTIVAANDLAQSALAVNLGPEYVGDLIRSVKAFMSKDTSGTNELKKMYQHYRERNLFHHTMGFNGLITDSVRDYSRLVGDGFAKMLAKQIGAPIDRSKGMVRGVLDRMFKTFHQYQNITWSIDEIMRMAVAEKFRRRFYPVQLELARRRRVQNPEATALDESLWLAVERTNMFLADYSRIPDYMRRSMNRFLFVPTFKVAQSRMYKNMFKEFGEGLKVLRRGVPEGQRFRVSDNRIKQALFLMAPLIRKVVYSSAIKGVAYGVLGFNAEDKLDMIKGYRLRKVINEDDPMNSMIRTLSLSTPMFELEKFFGRLGTGLNFRYFQAALPGLMFSIATNKDRVTGQRIWDRADNTRERTAKLGLHILKNFFPIGANIANLPKTDLDIMARVLNSSGLGYFYQTDSPNKLIELFYDSINKANTVGDRKKALQEFNRGIQRVNYMLLNERFRTFYDELAAHRDARLQDEL